MGYARNARLTGSYSCFRIPIMGFEVCWEWNISGTPCPGAAEAFAHLETGREGFLICTVGNHEVGYGFIQAAFDDSGYYLEAAIDEGGGRNAIYSCPGDPGLEEVKGLMMRFADGQDFSFIRKEWKYESSVERPFHQYDEASQEVGMGVIMSHMLIKGAVFVLLLVFLLYWLYQLFIGK